MSSANDAPPQPQYEQFEDEETFQQKRLSKLAEADDETGALPQFKVVVVV